MKKVTVKEKVVELRDQNGISTENHMEMFRRLTAPMFNSGAMHGTPGQKKGKS